MPQYAKQCVLTGIITSLAHDRASIVRMESCGGQSTRIKSYSPRTGSKVLSRIFSRLSLDSSSISIGARPTLMVKLAWLSDQKHPLPLCGQSNAQVMRCRGLGHTALLVVYCYDFQLFHFFYLIDINYYIFTYWLNKTVLP